MPQLPDPTPFDQLTPSTITTLVILSENIDLPAVFSLIQMDPSLDTLTEIPIDRHFNSGDILSAGYNGFCRGIISANKQFKNVITMRVVTSTKTVCVKLCPQKIHITGSRTREHATETSRLVLEKVCEVNQLLANNSINDNEAAAFLDSIRGEEVERQEDKTDHLIDLSNMTTLNNPLLKRVSTLVHKFVYYSDFVEQFNYIRRVEKCCEPGIDIADIHMVMVNCYFRLGYHVNLKLLDKMFSKRNEFTTRYNNSIDTNVTIQLPYVLEEGEKCVRRKDKQACHTFKVHRKGSVMQSGPGESRSAEAYDLFHRTLRAIAKEASIDNPLFGEVSLADNKKKSKKNSRIEVLVDQVKLPGPMEEEKVA